MKYLYLLIIGIVLSGNYASAQSCHKQATVSYSIISKIEEFHPKHIKQLASDASTIIVDVRTSEEFKEGHIENSINIPLQTLEKYFLSLKEYKNIVVVCKSGKRAEKAKTILTLQGFTNVYNGLGWESVNELLKSNK